MNTQSVNELLDRLAADMIEPEEWGLLESHASGRPALWREMAVAQYERDRFDRALDRAAATADTVELPSLDELPALPPQDRPATYRITQWNQWAGWALAAVLVLAFAIRFNAPETTSDGIHQSNMLPGEALNTYLTRGREAGSVISEVPQKVLIQTRPVADGGGYEVYYLRQILERTVVPDLYEYSGENELGQPTLVRFEQPLRQGM